MKIKLLLGFLILFIGVVFVLLNNSKNQGQTGKIQTSSNQTATKNTYSPQTTSEGNIEVNVEPKVSEDEKLWNFQITLTTHSGSLDQDLAKTSLLFESNGKQLSPKSWEGSPLGGHHREGVLSFPAFSKTPNSVRLILKDIGVPERSFTWNIK